MRFSVKKSKRYKAVGRMVSMLTNLA